MSYSVSIAVTGTTTGRVLASRVVERLRDARRWVARNSETWLEALDPDEQGFVAFIFDDEDRPILTIEVGRDRAVEPVEHNRAELAAMRGAT